MVVWTFESRPAMEKADTFQRRLGGGRFRVCDDLKLGRLAGHHVAGEIAGEGEEAGLDCRPRRLGWHLDRAGVWTDESGAAVRASMI